MPRQDWFDDDTMTRDRGERGFAQNDGGRDEASSRSSGGWMSGEGRDRERYGDRERSWDRNRERSNSEREDRRFGPDDHNRGIPMDETERLIASNKVEGTPVFDRYQEKLGTIHNFMVDKFSGRVVYAVLKHGGGFLGLNERYYPIEWDQLTYDTRLGGYHVPMVEDDLKNFGSFDRDGRWQSRHQERDERSGRARGRDRGRSGYDRDDGRGSRNPW